VKLNEKVAMKDVVRTEKWQTNILLSCVPFVWSALLADFDVDHPSTLPPSPDPRADAQSQARPL